ncbi:MAG: glycosyltransferase, partial [Polyangiaceae bacterium]|nr:glycosyltransferase [Polyangiaceae bacterium]
MMSILHALLVFAAIALAAPAVVFAVECLLGLLPMRSRISKSAVRPRLAVLVPAHDEETVLAATLADIRAQLAPGDRALVVADNCTDATATVAREAGAEVVERVDAERRGKGFALAFGVDALAADPPEVVVVVDADCRLHPGCLDALARTVAATGRPVQGEYLLATSSSSPLGSINALAFLVRNKVRPRGLLLAGGPCQLTGSGMAFPFALLSVVGSLGSNIVEDMVLGIELTYRGHAPILCPEARIEGELPDRSEAALGQRRRWEHGHLATLLTHGPRLL